MRFEIEKHRDKLKRISKLTDKELQESLYRLFTKIHFISEEQIPEKVWLKAEKLTADIDFDDIDFVALTDYLKGSKSALIYELNRNEKLPVKNL